MRQNRLGRSDLRVSAVGLGCNNFGRRLDLAGTRAVIEAALDAGITFLDTADIYGGDGASERMVGDALAGRRDRVVLATKFGAGARDGDDPRGSAAYARRALERSLARLGTDRVDLLFYHQRAKFRRGEPPLAGTRMADRPDLLTDATFDRVEAFAAERRRTLLELAVAGLASQPGVASVIAGAMTPEQVAANAAAGEGGARRRRPRGARTALAAMRRPRRGGRARRTPLPARGCAHPSSRGCARCGWPSSSA